MTIRGAGQLIEILSRHRPNDRISLDTKITTRSYRARALVKAYCDLLARHGVIFTVSREGKWYSRDQVYTVFTSGLCSQLQTVAHQWERINAR
jgi:hypothetical protein